MPALLVVIALVLLAPHPAHGQVGAESPLADLLEIVVVERELLAIDAESGGQRSERLHLGETVRWHGSRGRVGVVVTNERLLAVGTGSGSWQEMRYRSGEQLVSDVLLGDRVALAITNLRAIGFDGGSSNLVEQSLGPRERVLRHEVGENVAVVITDRRVLGLSPFVGGFSSRKMNLDDRVESVDAAANVATVTMTHRLLIYRSTSGSWEERRLDLR